MPEPKLNNDRMTEEEYLREYDITAYDRPSVTVDIMLLTVADTLNDNYRKLPEKRLKVLLIKRNEHPFIGQWALPGGFVQMDEDLESAAYRELEEETSVNNVYLEQLFTYGDVNRDPRGRIISSAYMSLVNKDEISTKAGSDASDAQWFDIAYKCIGHERDIVEGGYDEIGDYELKMTNEEHQLQAIVCVRKIVRGKRISYSRKVKESSGIAFDHGMILQQGIERLRNKLEYTDVVFHLLPELFTLTELQKTYEEILGKSLLKANFRRKTAKYVTETDFMTSEAGHRPSRLYQFNPDWSN